MDTINKITGAASNAIWGNKPAESGTEPVSGQQGKGTAEEPYDVGNKNADDMSRSGQDTRVQDESRLGSEPELRSNEDTASRSHPNTTSLLSESDGYTNTRDTSSTQDSSMPRQSDSNTLSRESQGLTTGGGTTGMNTAGPTNPDHDTIPTGANPLHSGSPHFSVERPSEANEPQRGSHVGGFGAADPSVSARPDSGANMHQKHQGGDRPAENPTGNPEAEEAVRAKTLQGEEAMVKDHPHIPSASQPQPSGMATGGFKLPNDRSEEKGTGQLYVKSTGVAAQGGNFDARAPGAGREADRLLEEQGIHRDHRDTTRTSIAAAGHHDDSKKSLGDKIKDKLHVGHHGSH